MANISDERALRKTITLKGLMKTENCVPFRTKWNVNGKKLVKKRDLSLWWQQERVGTKGLILYIKRNVCLFVPYTNPHFWTDRNQTLHTSPPWSGRDRRVCMGPKFLTSSTFWALFSLGATAESWAQDGCRRDRFPRYPYIRGSSCVRVTSPTLRCRGERSHPRQPYIRDSSESSPNVAEITSLQTTESSATASYLLFWWVFASRHGYYVQPGGGAIHHSVISLIPARVFVAYWKSRPCRRQLRVPTPSLLQSR